MLRRGRIQHPVSVRKWMKVRPPQSCASRIGGRAALVIVAIDADAIDQWLAADEPVSNRFAGNAVGRYVRQELRDEGVQRVRIRAVLPPVDFKSDSDKNAVAVTKIPLQRLLQK